jgi:plasmid stability protein
MGCMVNFNIRLPDDLHAKLKVAAERDRRSIHAEILWLLEHAVNATSGLTPP